METAYHVKRLIGKTVLFGAAALVFAQMSFAQGFISREYRPRWQQEYENFGGYDLRRNPDYTAAVYPTTTGKTQTMGVFSRVTYDPFGNFLLPGGTIYNYKWNQSRVGTSYGFDDTYSNKVFNNLMISADEFSNWQTRFMISNVSGAGTGMRAFFTPSTLKITNFGGVRWDLSSRKNNVTLLVQNSSGPTAMNLYGVHWQSILGDILKVGGTYVAQQRGTVAYSHTDIDNGPQGIRNAPRYIYLVLTDDSPEDTDNGPRIYDIKVRINGADITSQIPKRVFKITDFFSRKRYFNNDFQKQHIIGQGFLPTLIDGYAGYTESWFLAVMGNGASNPPAQTWNDLFSKSAKANNFGQLNLSSDPHDSLAVGRYFAADTSLGFQEATGSDVVIYEFLVPYESRDLKFDVLAANDYNIDLIAALYRQTQTTETDWNVQPLTTPWDDNWSVFYDTKNAAKSDGNVKDYSNTKWITVSYDRITGMNVYGLNAELNWRGLSVNAEINEYNSLWSYPLEEHLSGAARNKISARAWFVNFEKNFEKWSLGGEIYDYPKNYMRWYGTVDDNDDDDAYIGSQDAEGDTPGYDVDWDRQLDVAYSGQPYLTYYFDSVVFGDDFNHNGVIDARENDGSPDYPYQTNTKGHHFFVKLMPKEKTLFTLGYYETKYGLVVSHNQTTYFKSEYFHSLGRNLGEYSIQQRSELYASQGLYDLPMGHSFSNKALFHTRLKPIENLNVINDVLTGYSKSYGPYSRSAPNTTIEHTMKFYPVKTNRQSFSATFVHKADYTVQVTDRRIVPDIYFRGYRIMKEKRIKEFKFQPMIKFENSYYGASYNVRLRKYYVFNSYSLYPILRMDYRVAPNTVLRCGFQGFPGFPQLYRIRNVNTYIEYKLSEYNQRKMIIAFENRTLYQGFNLIVLMGVQKDKTTYVDPRGRKEPGATQYFINVQSESSR